MATKAFIPKKGMYFTIKCYFRKIQTQQARMGENGSGTQSNWLFAYPDSKIFYCLVSGKSIIKAQPIFNFDKVETCFDKEPAEYISVDQATFAQIDPEIMQDISEYTTAFENLLISELKPVQSDIIYIPAKGEINPETTLSSQDQSLFNSFMTKIKSLKK